MLSNNSNCINIAIQVATKWLKVCISNVIVMHVFISFQTSTIYKINRCFFDKNIVGSEDPMFRSQHTVFRNSSLHINNFTRQILFCTASNADLLQDLTVPTNCTRASVRYLQIKWTLIDRKATTIKMLKQYVFSAYSSKYCHAIAQASCSTL